VAESEIVGIEIGEFEAVPHNSTAAVNSADALFGALEPILHRIEPRRHP